MRTIKRPKRRCVRKTRKARGGSGNRHSGNTQSFLSQRKTAEIKHSQQEEFVRDTQNQLSAIDTNLRRSMPSVSKNANWINNVSQSVIYNCSILTPSICDKLNSSIQDIKMHYEKVMLEEVKSKLDTIQSVVQTVTYRANVSDEEITANIVATLTKVDDLEDKIKHIRKCTTLTKFAKDEYKKLGSARDSLGVMLAQ